MKKNTSFILFIIISLGILLRISNIDKPEGLWNDEYVSWYIAHISGLCDIFKNIFTNCHMPLYYFYLKAWMFFFGDSDTALRYSSVLPSVCSIFTMYPLGKEIKDKKTGWLCALVTAVSSFSIYFAQEVRLYSLVVLVSSLLILFSIKLIKNINKKDLLIFTALSIILIFLHTLGIIFVFFNTIFLLTALDFNNKIFNLFIKTIKHPITIISMLMFIIAIPLLYNIAFSDNLSQFWSGFSISKIILTFTDYFSPMQINIINTPELSSLLFNENKINSNFIFFAVIPAIIAFIGIISALISKEKIIKYLFFSAFSFFVSLLILALIGKIVLITKYSSEIYPILIILFVYGLFNIRKQKISIILFAIYLFINSFYLAYSNDCAFRKMRTEGNRAAVELIKNSRLKDNDFVLLTYYDKRKFDRYLVNTKEYNFYFISKLDFNYYIYNDDNYKNTIKNGKKLYKDIIKEYPNERIINYAKYTFQNKMKKGDRIGILFLDSVSFLSNGEIQKIVSDEKLYKEASFIFLTFSMLKNNLMYSFKDDYKIDAITQAGDWTLFVYEKTK